LMVTKINRFCVGGIC